MARVEQQNVISNKETFHLSSYYGIEIIIRDKDGYVNASKMVDKLSTKKSIEFMIIAIETNIIMADGRNIWTK
jgi:hypothetical protein